VGTTIPRAGSHALFVRIPLKNAKTSIVVSPSFTLRRGPARPDASKEGLSGALQRADHISALIFLRDTKDIGLHGLSAFMGAE
jgi:hypothetical protein